MVDLKAQFTMTCNLPKSVNLNISGNCLEEPAKSAVTGFALMVREYDSAIDLLRSRYATSEVIKRAHINELINLAQCSTRKALNG